MEIRYAMFLQNVPKIMNHELFKTTDNYFLGLLSGIQITAYLSFCLFQSCYWKCNAASMVTWGFVRCIQIQSSCLTNYNSLMINSCFWKLTIHWHCHTNGVKGITDFINGSNCVGRTAWIVGSTRVQIAVHIRQLSYIGKLLLINCD